MDNSKKKNYSKRDIVEVLLEDAYLKSGVVFNENTIKWGEIFNHIYDNKLTQEQLDDILSVENLMNPTYKAKLNK